MIIIGLSLVKTENLFLLLNKSLGGDYMRFCDMNATHIQREIMKTKNLEIAPLIIAFFIREKIEGVEKFDNQILINYEFDTGIEVKTNTFTFDLLNWFVSQMVNCIPQDTLNVVNNEEFSYIKVFARSRTGIDISFDTDDESADGPIWGWNAIGECKLFQPQSHYFDEQLMYLSEDDMIAMKDKNRFSYLMLEKS